MTCFTTPRKNTEQQFCYVWVNARTSCMEVLNFSHNVCCSCSIGIAERLTSNVVLCDVDRQQWVMGIASYGESCKLGRTIKTGDPLVMTFVPAYARWVLKTLYFLRYQEPYPFTFNRIKWSTGIEGDWDKRSRYQRQLSTCPAVC